MSGFFCCCFWVNLHKSYVGIKVFITNIGSKNEEKFFRDVSSHVGLTSNTTSYSHNEFC